MNDPVHDSSDVLVACLCAGWCGTCKTYTDTFRELAARFAGRVRFRWIDIEDEADLVDDVDVENFPTLLVSRGDAVRFFGTVTPHLRTAEAMVERVLADAMPPLADAQAQALGSRVRAQGDDA